MRRSREPSSRRASGGSWHFLKSVVCTTDTNAALPDLPPQTLPPSARKSRSVQPAISVCVPPRSAVPLRPRGAWKHRVCRRATVLGLPGHGLGEGQRSRGRVWLACSDEGHPKPWTWPRTCRRISAHHGTDVLQKFMAFCHRLGVRGRTVGLRTIRPDVGSG